jgi:tripartite-type tricarboxylate transporter receptor subunit TctC
VVHPTAAELGFPSLLYDGWYGFFAPQGTPKEIITRLNVAAKHALSDPSVQRRLSDIAFDVYPHDQREPEVLGEIVTTGVKKWWPIIQAAKIKAE